MIDYRGIFPGGNLGSLTNEDLEIIAAVDTEYTAKSPHSNLLLSWQFAVLNTFTGELNQDIIYVDYKNEERLDSNQVLQKIYDLASVDEDEIPSYRITLVGHYLGSEFAMFSNRSNVVQHRGLEVTYKTVVTFNSIRFPFKRRSGAFIKIKLIVGDTKLLLPLSHQSLEKASSLLDERYHKVALSQSQKENMLTLLLEDPKLFEEYALHDPLITLLLFIKLQYLLNGINGSTNIRFTTIGSATVKIFKNFIKEHFSDDLFKSQFTQDNGIYQKGLALAQRAYLGGLNNSYYVGEVHGDLILDIDFSSAYPTVMGLLPISDFGSAAMEEEFKGVDHDR